MRVADLDPDLLRAGGAVLGLAFGLLATRAADVLPRRHGIRHPVTGRPRARRNVALVILTVACWLGVAHVLAGAKDLTLSHALVLLATNGVAVTCTLAGAAIDLEHMILPNALTLGPALLCLATSPLRSIGFVGSIAGALVGLALSYLPQLVYSRIRGRSGMGLGDAKLAFMAGAWHGALGAPLVLLFGALQSVLAAGLMRMAGVRYRVPESVKAELDELRARARDGDAEAKSALDDDPMTAETGDGLLEMRLPLGPFLALACVEVLFLRRWLMDNVVGWLVR